MFKLFGIPATRHNREVSEPMGTANLSDIVVWIGLDAESVNQLVNDCGQSVGDEAIIRLRHMVEDGHIDLEREYTVQATVQVSGAVYHTVEAMNESEAADKVHEMIMDGGGLDDFLMDSTVDDISIEDVEFA